jgi:peptidoglycan/xylan/chitin deacetylase (PgdA/CDA1 family)
MLEKTMTWPGNANCAAMITINLDAEYFWLSLDPGCSNWPKTLSMGQYGIKRGLGRVLDVLDQYDVKATFFVPGRVAELYPEKIKEIASRGHELACHGYAHENLANLPVDEQRQALQKGADSIEKIGGVRPAGVRAPEGEISEATMRLFIELGFTYSSSLFCNDVPFFYADKETGKDIVEIPIFWELFDLPYFAFNYRPAFPVGQGRPANYTQVVDSWMSDFDGFYKYGLCYVTQFDPQTIGTPGRIALLETLLRHIREREDVWFATGSEMTKYVRSNVGK